MQDRLLQSDHLPQIPPVSQVIIPIEYRRLFFVYNSLSKYKKDALNELARNPYAEERYNVHFKRVSAILNIPRIVTHPKKGRAILLNFTDEDLVYYMECYKKNGLRALLFRLTDEMLAEEMKMTKDSLIIELLSLLQLMQNGKSAKDAKQDYSSIYKVSDIQHFFHMYNEKGLGFDLYLHSRKGIIWFLIKAYREALMFFGISTTMMWACKLTMGNLGVLGFSQTEYVVGTLFVAGQVIYNNPQSIAGIETTSVQLGLWLRLFMKALSDLVSCREQKVRTKTLITPFLEHAHGLTSLIVFALGNLVFKNPIEVFFRDNLDMDVTGTTFQRTFEPYVIIITLLLIAIGHLEAVKDMLYPCQECLFKTENDEEQNEEEAALDEQASDVMTHLSTTRSLNGSQFQPRGNHSPTLFHPLNRQAAVCSSSVASENSANSSQASLSP